MGMKINGTGAGLAAAIVLVLTACSAGGDSGKADVPAAPDAAQDATFCEAFAAFSDADLAFNEAANAMNSIWNGGDDSDEAFAQFQAEAAAEIDLFPSFEAALDEAKSAAQADPAITDPDRVVELLDGVTRWEREYLLPWAEVAASKSNWDEVNLEVDPLNQQLESWPDYTGDVDELDGITTPLCGIATT